MKDQFIEAHKEGNFLEILDSTYKTSKDKRNLIFETLASLHNDGDIDVLTEFQKLSNNFGNINFYSIRHVFEEILPKLDVSVKEAINCTKHFATEAGDDTSARSVFSTFTEYCIVDSTRSEKTLAISFDDEWLDFTHCAIIGGAEKELGKYLDIAIDFINKDKEQLRMIAVSAIGRINYNNNQLETQKAFDTLEAITQLDFDEQLFSTVLKSSYNLYKQDNNLDKKIIDLATTILSTNDDQLIHFASNMFRFDAGNLPTLFLDVLLKSLEFVNADNKGTLVNISHGLGLLIKNKQQEKAFSLLETLLIKDQNKLSLKDFDHFYHEIFFNEKIRNKVVTRWLISRNIPLCKAAMELVNQAHHKDAELSIDKSILVGHGKPDYVFIARKSIGWLLMNPVSSVSFIISFLDDVDKNEAKQILDAVFEFLLLNYPGKVKEYLEETISSQTKKVQKMLNKLLDDLKIYQAEQKETWELQELLPSQAHRESHSRLHNHQMSEAYKKAEKSSFMGLISTKVQLLYGCSSIHYISNLSGSDQSTRIETPLHHVKTSYEVARLDRINPHGSDYWMHIFRIEGCS